MNMFRIFKFHETRHQYMEKYSTTKHNFFYLDNYQILWFWAIFLFSNVGLELTCSNRQNWKLCWANKNVVFLLV